MNDDASDLFALSFGAGGALLLGMALTPFRGLTPAANFTFLFMALTILVAETGGRGAAIATALTSALSLDFFLTEPYRQLTIASKHDIIAFLGLAGCGLMVALFRGRRLTRTLEMRHLELVDQILAGVEAGGALGPATLAVLESCLAILPVAGLVVRDPQDDILISAGGVQGRRTPGVTLRGNLPAQAALPVEGLRFPLVAGGQAVGCLDVFGEGGVPRQAERALLTAVARALAARIAVSQATAASASSRVM
jgi:hypothetical protein